MMMVRSYIVHDVGLSVTVAGAAGLHPRGGKERMGRDGIERRERARLGYLSRAPKFLHVLLLLLLQNLYRTNSSELESEALAYSKVGNMAIRGGKRGELRSYVVTPLHT